MKQLTGGRMTPEVYKRICERCDVLFRKVLEETVSLIQLDLPPQAERIELVLSDSPVPKSGQDTGGPETDHFYVDLSNPDVEEIIEYLVQREAESAGEGGASTAQAARIASLVDAWNDYLRWTDEEDE